MGPGVIEQSRRPIELTSAYEVLGLGSSLVSGRAAHEIRIAFT